MRSTRNVNLRVPKAWKPFSLILPVWQTALGKVHSCKDFSKVEKNQRSQLHSHEAEHPSQLSGVTKGE